MRIPSLFQQHTKEIFIDDNNTERRSYPVTIGLMKIDSLES
jgi:hypothetical protein